MQHGRRPVARLCRQGAREVGEDETVLAVGAIGKNEMAALGEVRRFPPAIVRLTAVGEASNSLGGMLQRSGRMEEEAALRRIETIGRIAGPALIVLLGAILGVLMAGLLSGVSQMGQSALV